MPINELSKRITPFRPHDAKRVGDRALYIDQIIWSIAVRNPAKAIKSRVDS